MFVCGTKMCHPPVADPGFPVGGGVDLLGGGLDLRHGCFLAKMYAKTKEFGPVGGHVPGTPPPRSANARAVLPFTCRTIWINSYSPTNHTKSIATLVVLENEQCVEYIVPAVFT